MSRPSQGPETLSVDDLAGSSPTPDAPAPEPAETRDPAQLRPLHPTPVEQEVRGRGRRSLGRRLLASALGLIAIALVGAVVEPIVLAALSGGPWYSQVALAGFALLVLAMGVLAGREALALIRLRRLDRYRERARTVHKGGRGDDPDLLSHLEDLYRGRPELEWALTGYRQEARVRAGSDLPAALDAFERHAMAPLDAAAETAIARAARRAGGGAAISPFAALDIAITAIVDLRLVGEIARLYGGRPGVLASLRLLRIAFVDVVAAGALEVSQDTITDMVGANLTARVSGRAGSALVNALLTAKLGVAAVEACRPLPWHVRQPARARALVARAVGRWTQRD